jgi:hypothetical protein
MRTLILAATAGLCLVLAGGCTPAAKKAEACPDDGARLSITGLCQGRAVNYFDPERLASLGGVEGDLPEGCGWVTNETATPNPDEAILYQALSCNGKTTHLEFSGGGRGASLGYGTSGFFENVPKAGEEGSELVRLFPLEGNGDPKAMILAMAKGMAAEEKAKPAEIAACEMRPMGAPFPADTFVVDVSDAYKKTNKLGDYDGRKDGPDAGAYAVCGSYGFTTDGRRFWMIRDGYAWFVDQGQDMPDFDSSSLSVFRKGADGVWAPAS